LEWFGDFLVDTREQMDESGPNLDNGCEISSRRWSVSLEWLHGGLVEWVDSEGVGGISWISQVNFVGIDFLHRSTMHPILEGCSEIF
jgi:hypothetical protein